MEFVFVGYQLVEYIEVVTTKSVVQIIKVQPLVHNRQDFHIIQASVFWAVTAVFPSQ